MSNATQPREQFYGRRRGRPLRAGQRERQTQLLPGLSFILPETGKLDPRTLFTVLPNDIWLEIGFGGGEHLAEQAARRPGTGFIGCEVFENGVAKLLGEVERRGLGNVRVYADDARPLLAALAPRSIGRVFILFPDPWPKARHHKRRLVAPPSLDRLAEIMKDGAELRLATDDPSYLSWMLEHVTAHPAFVWTARRPGDWRDRPEDWPATRYEEKARKAGRMPAFLRFQRRPRN
ncbi:MAG TPA: tRNA (guanosine(46)-N7)-methyltransferase TrmB [Stellaceae bacterium]|jgi:tRNA (guanine-N7-)-methyltransferase|nr:tRNA (guanosine(46)-N7)-methyltransferase TrmB [Stellaceae bacterium]